MAGMTFPPEGWLGSAFKGVRAGPVLLAVEQKRVQRGPSRRRTSTGWPSLRGPAGRRRFWCPFALHERRVSVLENEFKLS